MTKLKICGLSRPEDMVYANRYRPDYVGFVFAESRRRVTPEQAAELKTLLSPQIQTVGVFVNSPLEEVAALCNSGVIDLVQLHGDESELYMRKLRREITLPIIKAVRVRTPEQILRAQELPCEILLLDTYVEGQRGGSGKSFDHSIIPPISKPFFLAGGLNVDTIPTAIASCSPYGVDVSSGAESDGYKDEAKIRAITRLLSGGERSIS
jgi:phosphoribosylanthranilate isomerase